MGVERTLAWLSKCRALLARYDKQPENYLGLLKVAAILLVVPPLVAPGTNGMVLMSGDPPTRVHRLPNGALPDDGRRLAPDERHG